MQDFFPSLSEPLVLLIVSFDLVVRGLALWRASKNSHKWWFVALMVINSMGLLPLLYLALVDKEIIRIDLPFKLPFTTGSKKKKTSKK